MSSEYNVLRAANGENPWNDAVSIEAIEEESTTEIPDSGDGTGDLDPKPVREFYGSRHRGLSEQEADLVRRSQAVAYEWAVEALNTWLAEQNDKGSYLDGRDFLEALRGVQERVHANLTSASIYTARYPHHRFNPQEPTDG